MAVLFDSESGEMMSHDVDKTIGHFELFFDTDVKKSWFISKENRKKIISTIFFWEVHQLFRLM